MPTDKKITELPVASSINPSDVSVLVSNNTDYQYNFTTLLQFLQSNLSTGASISFGTVLPQNIVGKNGDVFVNTASGSFAQKLSGTWTIVYSLPAANAADGTLLYGAGQPGAGTGKNADSYINTLTGIFYQKTSGSWTQVFSMATGPQGPQGTAGVNGTDGTDGNSVLFGDQAPSNTGTGKNGDFYINTSTYLLFGPKTGGVWGDGVPLIGAGIQPGGTTGQILSKASNGDYDTKWQDNSFANLAGSPMDNTNLAASLSAKQDLVLKNQPDGYAGLDGSGKIAAVQLPSYVDDVLEFANHNALPATGETGKIYVTLDDNKEYRWSGSTYIELVPSPGSTDAVPEGTGNLYFTAARVLSSILTGIGFSNATAISATDTILGALGKLQAQIAQLFTRTVPTGGTTGQVLAKVDNTDGNTQWVTPIGGSGNPGGADTQIQFNSSGSFAGSNQLTFDGTSLHLGNAIKQSSALMQLDSTSKGLLLPSMTEAQRLAITSPAQGLIVYQTDAGATGEGVYQYRSTGWVSASSGAAGTDGQIQFNSGGGLGASSNFSYNPTTLEFYVKSKNYDGYIIDAPSYSGISFASGGTSYGYIGAGQSSNISNTNDLSIMNTNSGRLSFEASQILFYGNLKLPSTGFIGTNANGFIQYSFDRSFYWTFNWGGTSGSPLYNLSFDNAANHFTTPQNGSDFLISSSRNVGICNDSRGNDQGSVWAQFMASTRSFILNDGDSAGFNPAPGAMLQLDSIDKGFLTSRMTSAQKNAIVSPAQGLLVYDTSLNKLCIFTGSIWETITSS